MSKKRSVDSVSEFTSKKVKTKSDTTCVFEGKILVEDGEVREREGYTANLPKRNKSGALVFEDEKEFRPNLSPKEVLQAGSFGGSYFRPIKSSVTGLRYNKQWQSLPQNWLEGLEKARLVSSSDYNTAVNKYKVKCGGDLAMWESSGWIVEQDPYGWFQWYCRYYLGRRSPDDERQIKRWKNCTGPKGRWKNNLIGKLVRSGKKYDDFSVSPVIRQVLLHWAYQLTEADFEARKKVINAK